MKQIHKKRICIKVQTYKKIYIIFLAFFLAAYLFFGAQTALSKNIKALGGGIGHTQYNSENLRHLLNNNVSPKELKIIAIKTHKEK